MSKKLLALLLALVMIVGSFTSVLAADPVKTEKPAEEKKEEPAKTEEKKDEKSEEKKDEKSEEKKDEKSEEKKEEKKEEVKDEALLRAIDVLKKAGFISGYSKDSEDFKVEKNVTRAEFASMIVRVKGLEDSAKALATVPTGFKDVPTNLWANGYIAVAKQQGFINGYPNGTFQPNRQISYQDMATMLTIALGKAEAGTVYPAGYIVKAQQLGLFNNVKPLAYTDMATRGDVFKMVYNMVTSKEFGQRKIVKAIVLENARVEKLAADEITVEVIDVVQKADWANASRDKKGDQHTYKLDKDLKLDVEQLLGKVVDITVDQNDKIVEVKEDHTYDYKEGKIKSVSRTKINLDNVAYSVGFDERYNETDERIFRTYLNNRNYTYKDFEQGYSKYKNYDFARITLKNGKVIFIDAYQFDDVAPVDEVKDGDVYYLDDVKVSRKFKAAALKSRVIFHDAKGYVVADKKDIVKDDVIHFYNNYENAIVRRDAKLNTKFVKTHRDQYGDEYVVGKDDEYLLNLDAPFRAIFSYEGKLFDVVTSRADLDDLVGDDVKILLALDNTVQLVETNKQWKDGVHVVKKVISKGEVLLQPAKGERFWAAETRDTKYVKLGRSNNNRLLAFGEDDLVYYAGNDKNEIGKMGTLSSYPEYSSLLLGSKIDKRYITSGSTDYRYFDGVYAFYIDEYKHLQAIPNMEEFYKANKDNGNLKSYVISERDLKDRLKGLDVNLYNFLSGADDIASVVVFDGENVDPAYETIYAEVTDKWGWLDQARFVDENGKEYIVNLGNKDRDFEEKDIVELKVEKASMKEGSELKGKVAQVVIPANQATDVVEQTRQKNTILVNGKAKYTDKETHTFGRQSSDYAQVAYQTVRKANDYILVIRYTREKIGGKKVAKSTFILEKNSYPERLIISEYFADGVGKNPNVPYGANERTRYFFKGIYQGEGRYGFANMMKNVAAADILEVEFLVSGNLVTSLNVVTNAGSIPTPPAAPTTKQLAEKDVKDAKALVENILGDRAKKLVYNIGTTDKNVKDEIEGKVNAALMGAGLDKAVTATVTAASNKVAVELKSVKDNTVVADKTKTGDFELKEKDYVIVSAQDVANAIQDAILRASDGTIPSTTPADVTAEAVRLVQSEIDKAKLTVTVEGKTFNINFDKTKLSSTVTAVAGKVNTYKVEFTYDGTAAQNAKEFTLK